MGCYDRGKSLLYSCNGLKGIRMTQVNPFYALVDEDGDIQEMFPENISIDWIYQVKDVKERANNETYKIIFIDNFSTKVVE